MGEPARRIELRGNLSRDGTAYKDFGKAFSH